jgi:hypothetical protein
VGADLELLVDDGPFGDVRHFAIGGESRLLRRVTARAGFRVNTAGEDRAPAFSVGGSFAVKASALVDAQITTGSDRAGRGWGIAGRFVF